MESNTVEAELRHLIAGASIGTRLPSIRDMASRHRVSPVTVQHLITRLEREGLVEPKPGRGTFVTGAPAERAGDWNWQTVALGTRPVPGEGMVELLTDHPPDVVSLAMGYPDRSLQAIDLLTSAVSRAARRPGAWERSPAQGSADLRNWFASDIGGGVRAEDVVIVCGGQAALSAAFRSLASPGDAVVLESPTYVGAIDAARLAGLLPTPVPRDEQGMRADLLDDALRATRARLVYVQPFAANPTGAGMSAARRNEVIQVARANDAFIIEDDFVHDVYFGDPPPAPMLHHDRDGHVIYVRSLTKSAAPSLRIAAMVARGPALRRLRNARLVDDFFVSTVMQEAALIAVTSSGWPRHLRRLRRAVSSRIDAAIDAIGHEAGLRLTTRPAGGFVVWVGIDDRIDDRAAALAALHGGVAVTPGSLSFCSEPPGSFLRLSVAGADESQINEGIRRLGSALRAM